MFFDCVWNDLDLSELESEANWDQRLVKISRGTLENAFRMASTFQASSVRLIACAENVFERQARKNLGGAYQKPLNKGVSSE